MRKAAMLVLAAAICLAGCGTATPRLRPAASTAPDISSPARASAALGFDMLRRLPSGNLVFSPDSVAAAVAMVGEGARGMTAAEIVHTLHSPSAAALGSFGALQATILGEQLAASRGAREPAKLSVADGLFVQQDFPIEAPFLQSLQRSFEATPQGVDFRGHLAEATNTVNEWISAHTEGAIPSISAELPPKTGMALANAVYLKALWADEFPEGGANRTFHGPRGAQHVPFMGQTEEVRYSRGPGYAAVSLPYASSTLSMLVVLPDTTGAGGVREVQRRLTAAGLASLTARMRTRAVELAIPRFHIGSHERLNVLLSALGMGRAFTERADFSGISSVEALRVGEVLHATDIRVDERGTTAAAATLLTVEPTSEQIYRHLVRFDADRPFLFFVRDQRTGTVLFAGRLVDAAAAPTPAPGNTAMRRLEAEVNRPQRRRSGSK
jgi:serpin B